ncbi:MAG: hypothetical protein ACREOO_08160 [bacterium]
MPQRIFPEARFALAAVLIALCPGCAELQQMQDALLNLQRLQFKLDKVAVGSLAGVDLTRVNDLSRFSLQDGLKLTNAFANKSMPLSFTLNVAAKNPNDGTSGNPQKTAVLQGLAWTLRVDDQETVSGDIASPIEIPGTGQATVIPLQVKLDLYSFFQEQGYKNLLNLALAIAGQSGSASRFTLAATPTVSVAGVPIKYPGQINIIDKEYTN